MKKKSIDKIFKWFSMMENEEYTFPKTKEELFKLKRLDLCCLCHRVPKEIKYFKHLEELILGLTYIKKYTLIQYIFASTMHKLQGSTYEQCYINLFDLAKNRMSLDDKYRLIYVAITRASKDIKIFISKLDEEVIQLNNLDTDKYFENMDFILLNTLQLEKL